jgi:hypothetical protein
VLLLGCLGWEGQGGAGALAEPLGHHRQAEPAGRGAARPQEPARSASAFGRIIRRGQLHGEVFGSECDDLCITTACGVLGAVHPARAEGLAAAAAAATAPPCRLCVQPGFVRNRPPPRSVSADTERWDELMEQFGLRNSTLQSIWETALRPALRDDGGDGDGGGGGGLGLLCFATGAELGVGEGLDTAAFRQSLRAGWRRPLAGWVAALSRQTAAAHNEWWGGAQQEREASLDRAALLKAKQALWELRVRHWSRLGPAERHELTSYFEGFAGPFGDGADEGGGS